jgi:hypothetical protein
MDRRFVRVRECRGKEHVLPDAENALEGRPHELRHVIVNLDSDAADGREGSGHRSAAGLQARLTARNGSIDAALPNSCRAGDVLVSRAVLAIAFASPPSRFSARGHDDEAAGTVLGPRAR